MDESTINMTYRQCKTFFGYCRNIWKSIFIIFYIMAEIFYNSCRDIEIVIKLLSHPKISPNIKDKYGMTPLLDSCRDGLTESVRKLIYHHPTIDLNIQDNNGMTPLHYACMSGFTKILRELLSHPAIDPNIKDKNGLSPLNYVCKNQCRNGIFSLRELLSHPKIDPNSRDEDGNTPIHASCHCIDDSLYLKYLLKHSKIDPNVQNINGYTALHLSCLKGWSCSQYFTDENILLKEKKAIRGSTEKVKELLSHEKIKPSIRSKENNTALDIVNNNSENENFLKDFTQKEKKLTEDFCLAMIQPHLSLSPKIRQNKAKELRREQIRLGPELIKLIASFLELKDISNKSCNEIVRRGYKPKY